MRRINKCFMVLFSRSGWLPGPRLFPCVKFLEDSGVVWQCGVQLLRMLPLLAADFVSGIRRHVPPRWSTARRSRRILFRPLQAPAGVDELRLPQALPVREWLLVSAREGF